MFKRCGATHATLWPFDLPFPGDDDGDDGETKTDQAQTSEPETLSENDGYAGEPKRIGRINNNIFLYFLFKVVPVPDFNIPPTLRTPKAIIIQCLAAIWVRIWNRVKRECCRMSYNKDEMLACHYTYAVRFAKKSLNKRVRFCSTVAFILNPGHTRAPNAANVSDNNRISHSIYEYTPMKNRTVAFTVRASSGSEPFWIR